MLESHPKSCKGGATMRLFIRACSSTPRTALLLLRSFRSKVACLAAFSTFQSTSTVSRRLITYMQCRRPMRLDRHASRSLVYPIQDPSPTKLRPLTTPSRWNERGTSDDPERRGDCDPHDVDASCQPCQRTGGASYLSKVERLKVVPHKYRITHRWWIDLVDNRVKTRRSKWKAECSCYPWCSAHCWVHVPSKSSDWETSTCDPSESPCSFRMQTRE